jgi:hypothetical protein
MRLARVAQRIERHRPKVGVGGSSPSAGTNVAHVLTTSIAVSALGGVDTSVHRRNRLPHLKGAR